MKNIKQILFSILIIIVFFISGFFLDIFTHLQKKEIVKKEVRSNIINRDLSKIPQAEKDIDLKHYEVEEFILDIEPSLGKGNYVIYGSLYNRQASREINIPVSESGNFKFYLGIGIGILGTGLLCYAGYKIFGG